jgi:hypothetical protein
MTRWTIKDETEKDQLRRYRRERALWSLDGMMTWCLERGDELQLEALTNMEIVLNELMIENAKLRAVTRPADAT